MPRNEHGRGLLSGSADPDSVDSFMREAVAISEPSTSALTSLGLMSGDVLDDRFVVEELAGSGGMGAIYRGKDLRTAEAVAIKVMALSGTGDASRFAQEAVVLADLSHPSALRACESFVQNASNPILNGTAGCGFVSPVGSGARP